MQFRHATAPPANVEVLSRSPDQYQPTLSIRRSFAGIKGVGFIFTVEEVWEGSGEDAK